MKRAKGSVPPGPAAARNTARNSGDGGAGDEPIYKALPMPTVARMFKRFLTLAAGVVLGAALVEAWPRVAAAWNFWPDRGLARASARVREVIYGAEDYERSKPAPDGYLKALATMKMERDEAIVFEDSVAGLASAKAAGVRSVAITCTNHFGHDQSVADVCIPDFASIDSAWIKNRFA